MERDFITKVLYGEEGKQGGLVLIHEGMQGIMIQALRDVMREEVNVLCG